MLIYRCLFKDFFYETDATTPDNWTNIGAATWLVESAGMAGNDTYCMQESSWGFPGAERWCVISNTLTQDKELEYYVTMAADNSTHAGWYMRFYFYCSANTGIGFGNSYIVEMTSANLNLYKSAAGAPDVITKKKGVVAAHSADTNYSFKITYDPDTGIITVYEGSLNSWTEKLTWTDGSPLTSGSYIGVSSYEVAQSDFTGIKVRRPADTPPVLEWPHVIQTMSDSVGTFTMMVKLDDAGDCEYSINDGVEIELQDGSTKVEDFDGCVEKIEIDLKSGIAQVSGRDWRGEGYRVEGWYAAGANKVDAVIRNIIQNQFNVLREGNVENTGDAAVARACQGKTAYDTIQQIAMEADLSIWQDFKRALWVTTTYPASGITISDTDPVADATIIEDGYDIVNEVKIYGSSLTGGARSSSDGSSQTTYGVRKTVLVDNTMPDDNHADSFITNLMARSKNNPRIVEIIVADYHELMVGDSLTVDLSILGLSSEAAICVGKEYGPHLPGIKFTVVLGTVEHRRSTLEKIIGRMGARADDALSQHS